MKDHRKHFYSHSDGRFIHPNAPAGGCGPGYSTIPGPQIGHSSPHQLPHPDSPVGRMLHHHEINDAHTHHFPINVPQRKTAAAIPKTVRRGDQGEDVQKLQRLLNAHLTPSPNLKIDGIFGPLTEQAVQQYQKGVSIRVDGIVGKQTWFYLLKADKAKYVQPVQNAPSLAANKLTTPSSAGFSPTSIPLPNPVNTFTRPNAISNAQTGIWEWSMKDKFIEVLRRTKDKLPSSMQQEFSQLISKESLEMMAGTLVVWVGSHAFGVGEFVDIGLLGIGIYYLGRATFQVVGDLKDFLVITSTAKDDNDLNDAASHLARAISIIGVVAFVALLAKVASKGLGKAKASESSSIELKNEPTQPKSQSGVNQTRRVSSEPKEPINQTRNVAETNTSPKIPKANSEIRQWYNDQISKIPKLNESWQEQGISAEERAKMAHEIRHEARVKARSFMQDDAEVSDLRARDMEKYGNPDGPTYEYLVEQNKQKGLQGDDIYNAIIDSSNRPNQSYNQRFNITTPSQE